jgi:hypothetical protein
MTRAAVFAAFSLLGLTTLSLNQEPASSDYAKLNELRQRAERGDVHAQSELAQFYEFGLGAAPKDYAEALRWYRQAADQGDSASRDGLGRMYFSGVGVKQDYAESARWYQCPRPSEKSLASCRSIGLQDLPQGATALLTKMKCDPGPNYNYGSAVELNNDGTPEYQLCCHDSPHGPGSSVVIGKIGSEWKDLTAKEGLFGFDDACGQFFVLESQHRGFHDVCLPYQCSTLAKGKSCVPTIWQFDRGRYHSVLFPSGTPK